MNKDDENRKKKIKEKDNPCNSQEHSKGMHYNEEKMKMKLLWSLTHYWKNPVFSFWDWYHTVVFVCKENKTYLTLEVRPL